MWPALLAAMVMLVQGLAPAGAMAAPTADGRVAVQICTHDGLKTVMVGDAAPALPSLSDCCGHCVMAAAATAPAAPVGVSPVHYSVDAPTYGAAANTPKPRARPPPRPPSQGPPHIV